MKYGDYLFYTSCLTKSKEPNLPYKLLTPGEGGEQMYLCLYYD